MTGLTLFDFDFSGDKPAPPPQLRDYQAHDVERTEAKLAAHRRVLYVLPTGGGKTTVFSHMAIKRAQEGERVVIFVHRKELLEQASRKIAAYGVGHGLIMPDRPLTRDLVQVASIDTVAARLERLRPFLETVSLAIPDEAHHAVAKKWQRVLGVMANAQHLGATATPFRTDGRGLGEAFDDYVEGPSIRDLIARGALVPVHTYRPPSKFNLAKVKKRAGDYAADELEALIDVDEVTKAAIANYRKYADRQPCIVFCSGVRHAHNFAAACNLAGYRAAAVDGETPTRERSRRIAGLGNGELDILTSYDLIGEGTDIPIVSAALDLRPTQSTLIYQQHLGRIMRPAPGKTHAIAIDQADNFRFHGMPDEARRWSLKGGIKGLERAVTATMRCRSCYRAHAVALECPGCGKVYPLPKPPPPPAETDDDLPAADAALSGFTDGQLRAMSYGALMKLAKTEEALTRVAIARGYKPGWVRYRLEEKQAWKRGRR